MVPAPVIAQDPSAPESQEESEPSVEPEPEPEPSAEPEPSMEPASEPSVEPEPEPDRPVEPAQSVEPEPEPEPGRARPVGEPSSEPEPSPEPSAEPVSVDDDGVPAEVEDEAPNGGDGNLDGVLDSEQANVASLPTVSTSTGTVQLDDLVTIESPPGTILQNVRAVSVPTDPRRPPASVFPAGLFDYEVVVAEPAIQPPSRSISRMARSARSSIPSSGSSRTGAGRT